MIETAVRLINAILDSINRVKQKRAVDHTADTIANGGRVQQSEKSFSELSDESGSYRDE